MISAKDALRDFADLLQSVSDSQDTKINKFFAFIHGSIKRNKQKGVNLILTLKI